MKRMKKVLAICLCTVLLTSFCAEAFADGEADIPDKGAVIYVSRVSDTQFVIADPTKIAEDESKIGNIDVQLKGLIEGSNNGMDVQADVGGKANVKVEGNILGGDAAIDDNFGPGPGLHIGSEVGSVVNVEVQGNVTGKGTNGISINGFDGTASVTVNGDVTGAFNGIDAESAHVNGDFTGAFDGIDAVSAHEGKTNVQVTGNVTGGKGSGIQMLAEGSGDSATASIKGDIRGFRGVNAVAFNGGEVKADITGNITGSNREGVAARAEGNGSDASVAVNGDVVGSGVASLAVSKGGGTANVTVQGNSKGNDTPGTAAHSWGKGSVSNVVIEGNSISIRITEDTEEGSDHPSKHGVLAQSFDGGTSTLTVRGSAEGDELGVFALSENGGTTSVTTGGAKGKERGAFAGAAGEGTTEITVNGNIEGPNGIKVNNNNSTVNITAVNLPTEDELKANAASIVSTAKENMVKVISSLNGIEILQTGANAQTNILIDGILSVEKGGKPILLSEHVNVTDVGNINITVWKIEGQDGNQIVFGGEDGAAAALQERINYLIKIAPDPDSLLVFGSYKGGDTLHEGKQRIAVTVPDGFELTSAYATDGTDVPVTKGEDGRYYAEIPAGGGIYLNAKLTPITPTIPDNSGNNDSLSSGGNSDRENTNDENGFTVEYLGNTAEKKSVSGTVDGRTVTQDLGNVLNASAENNEAFRKSFEAASDEFRAAEPGAMAGGTVDFHGMFENASENKINVPVPVPGARLGAQYNVLFSDGTKHTVTCTENGTLDIPFPKNAAGLAYLVLPA